MISRQKKTTVDVVTFAPLLNHLCLLSIVQKRILSDCVACPTNDAESNFGFISVGWVFIVLRSGCKQFPGIWAQLVRPHVDSWSMERVFVSHFILRHEHVRSCVRHRVHVIDMRYRIEHARPFFAYMPRLGHTHPRSFRCVVRFPYFSLTGVRSHHWCNERKSLCNSEKHYRQSDSDYITLCTYMRWCVNMANCETTWPSCLLNVRVYK